MKYRSEHRSAGRHWRRRRGAAAALLAGVLGGVLASAGPGQAILGMVRAVDGQPVPQARITFCPGAAASLPWQSAPPDAEPRGLVTGYSDARGAFRIEVPQPATLGGLLVEHPEAGVGWVQRIDPGVPRIVRLAPAGHLRLASGDRFDARLRALGDGAAPSIRLPKRGGARIALPTGRYALLVTVGNRAMQHICRVESGAERALADPPVALRLPRLTVRAGTGRLSLPDWPGLRLDDQQKPGASLLLPAANGEVRLLESFAAQGAAGAAFVEHRYDGRSRTVSLRPDAAQPSIAWRTITLRHAADRRPLVGATVAVIERQGQRDAVRSRWASDTDGRARVVTPTVGADDGYIVVHVPGHAPLCYPRRGPDELSVALRPCSSLRLRVETTDPVADAPTRITIEQPPFDILIRRGSTNPRGEILFEDLAPGRTRIRVEQPDHLPGEHTIELAAGEQSLVLELQPGLTLRGRVRRGGKPIAGAVVELRPRRHAGARPDARLRATDRAGRFVFRGLQDREFVLVASREADGVTWTAQRSGVVPGRDAFELELRSEDPPLPGSRPSRREPVTAPRDRGGR